MGGFKIKAVKLKKLVQMFQWYETEDRKEDPTNDLEHEHVESTYSYARDWFDYPIPTEGFHNTLGHHNPESWPFNSSKLLNQRVKIGGFLLGPNLKMHAGIYYHSKNMWQPDVGDFRVHFSYAGKG